MADGSDDAVGATAEGRRLREPSTGPVPPWRAWGPYVSDRAWATVREDYSADGSAWTHLPHDLARSKAYRWGEDGLAAVCDRYQRLVLGIALWNGVDPILKERLFGLTPHEGNHGEDAKEHWHHLDATPSHSYQRVLYRYPQAPFPYEALVEGNRRRGAADPELELADTGVFDAGRYFDVVVEHAKASPDDLCVRIEVANRGPEAAALHVLPQLWFRNTWSWTDPPGPQPLLRRVADGDGAAVVEADDGPAGPLPGLPFDYLLGRRLLVGPPARAVLLADNETNGARVYGPHAVSRSAHPKDAFHRHVVDGEDSCNPAGTGTKAALWYVLSVPAGGTTVLHLRFADADDLAGADRQAAALAEVDDVVAARRAEADEFYDAVHPPGATADERLVQRQALAGMLLSKQVYLFDVATWLDGDQPSAASPPEERRGIRNTHWRHLNSMRVLSMPDKWEYPWFAAWDLAFQCLTLALVDEEFAKENLWALLFEQFQHPNGQIPAYEWEFSDLNPPVHAWACWEVYQAGKRAGRPDRPFLERCFHKLLINFAWWVNRVDSSGNNVFEGGFLGLDNISVVDRSQPLADGDVLEQSDATGWMGFFCLSLMRIALELCRENPTYELLATKFFQHFTYIVGATKRMGGRDYQLWDDEDGFFYDVLRHGDGTFDTFRVRSLVGLIPLYAVEVLDAEDLASSPQFRSNLEWFLANRTDLVGDACWGPDDCGRYVLSMVSPGQLERLLQHLWDADGFLSPYGFRSLSKHHDRDPFRYGDHVVRYEPAEAQTKIKGGNSNWRGPVWFPTSYLLLRSLTTFSEALGPGFSVPAPAGDGDPVAPAAMAREVADRMIALFTLDGRGRRPFWGHGIPHPHDPSWRDALLFHEYFHGDTGAGLGASHQTGWTGLVANLIDEWRR
jgi:hypothetical protein